jgi:hypothetical protein
MASLKQMSMCCPCGIEKVLALGLCATCYTLRRQDEEYFGGHREEVLKRTNTGVLFRAVRPSNEESGRLRCITDARAITIPSG